MLYSPESRYYYMFLSFGGLAAKRRLQHPPGALPLSGRPVPGCGGQTIPPTSRARRARCSTMLSIAPYGVKVMGNWQFLPVAGEPAAATTGYLSPDTTPRYSTIALLDGTSSSSTRGSPDAARRTRCACISSS